jgi:membrane protease YdiL (CAAX protease family)
VITAAPKEWSVPRRFVFPLVHLPVFLFANVAWIAALTVVFVSVIFAWGPPLEELVGADTNTLMRLLGPGWVGAMAAAQMAGLAVIATVLCLFLPAPSERSLPWLPGSVAAAADRLRVGLALRRPSLVWVATALLGATTVWMFPTWVADRLIELFPGHTSSLEVLGEILQSSEGFSRFFIVVALVITAPLFEELVFRGYLWRVVGIAAPAWVAAVATTLVFAAYHIDPVHVVALLPTAVFMGWLRYASRSIFPCMVAHLTNNAIATGLALGQPSDSTDTMTFGLALTGLSFTIVTAFVGARFARAPR